MTKGDRASKNLGIVVRRPAPHVYETLKSLRQTGLLAALLLEI